MELRDLYELVQNRRLYQLDHYKDVDEAIFHQTAEDNTWSAEMIYRHFLFSNAIIKKILTDIASQHPMAIVGGPTATIIPTATYSIKEIEDAIKETGTEILYILETDSTEKLKQVVTSFDGKKQTKEERIVNLLLHDSEHLGELKWTFKRLANYDDNDMYRIKG